MTRIETQSCTWRAQTVTQVRKPLSHPHMGRFTFCLADLLDFLLPLVPSQLLAGQNHAGSTPLHWAALNKHLGVARKLILHPNSPGRNLIDMKNNVGRSPLGEAEAAGWDEGAKLFVEVMILDSAKESQELVEDAEILEDKDHNGEVNILDNESGKTL